MFKIVKISEVLESDIKNGALGGIYLTPVTFGVNVFCFNVLLAVPPAYLWTIDSDTRKFFFTPSDARLTRGI